MRRVRLRWTVLALVLAAASAARAELRITPREATVGDPLEVRWTLDPRDGVEPQRGVLGPEIGPFSVLDERWVPEPAEDGTRWTWEARVAAYETGELEFPALTVRAGGGGGEAWSSEPLPVTIGSVLEDAGEDAEIADLKGPAEMPPQWGSLVVALLLVAALLALAAVGWWLHRRWAAKLAAVPAPEDPFARTPPHEWAFAALRELLDERLVERGEIDRFYERLAWILKRYLGGRYRLDLLEHTTDEVRPLLEQAGVPGAVTTRATAALAECDAVKFARLAPAEAAHREIVERVYSVIDRTRPQEETPTSPEAA